VGWGGGRERRSGGARRLLIVGARALVHVPVLGAGDVQQVVGGVEVETEARRAP